eukprot:1964777-Alexandrium_andersonii.AAC.1
MPPLRLLGAIWSCGVMRGVATWHVASSASSRGLRGETSALCARGLGIGFVAMYPDTSRASKRL